MSVSVLKQLFLFLTAYLWIKDKRRPLHRGLYWHLPPDLLSEALHSPVPKTSSLLRRERSRPNEDTVRRQPFANHGAHPHQTEHLLVLDFPIFRTKHRIQSRSLLKTPPTRPSPLSL
ncbi:hypothetical protein CapIbe_012827 [Capra ibex]